tara:strand:+ start:3230 stop:3664 length:435 start_codon:yes stop_codon:yes gene_type:complete
MSKTQELHQRLAERLNLDPEMRIYEICQIHAKRFCEENIIQMGFSKADGSSWYDRVLICKHCGKEYKSGDNAHSYNLGFSVKSLIKHIEKKHPEQWHKDDWMVRNWAYDYIEKDIRNIKSLFSYSPEYKMINTDFWEIKRASWK